MTNEIYETMRERYQSGDALPWDDTLPPPEVVNLVTNRSAGRALDLGCGYGRASIYMAQRGWEVDGVDFIEKAIRVAKQRACAAGVAPQFHQGDVTNLRFLAEGYDLAIDVGCVHVLNSAEITHYINELARLLNPNADYLMYARLQEATVEKGASTAVGLDETLLLQQFAPAFTLLNIEYGKRIDFHAPWKSAWLHFQRRAEG
ncbi:MAG: class I SAM-dependent methyltransferase [Candidatus Promineifilaceae bacterium]